MADAPATDLLEKTAKESPPGKRANSTPEEKPQSKKAARSVSDKKNFVESAVILIKANTYNPVWEKVKTEKETSKVVADKELNRLVGGYLETVPFEHVFRDELPLERPHGRYLVAYCNEEGRLQGMPFNDFTQEFGLRGAYGLVGDIVVALADEEDETLVFTEKDLDLLPKALLP
jgi:hypothetical protein